MLSLVDGEEFKGSKKVTCIEAVELLKKQKTCKVFWRPDGKLSKDPDNDPAYIWSEND
jgi:hypothetical protein